MLEASGQVVYINEPMSTKRPPGGSPGVLRAAVRHKFHYVDPQEDEEWRRAFSDTLALRFRPGAEIASVRSPYHLARGAKYAIGFTVGSWRGKRAMLDDPNALFSARWLNITMGVRAVIVVRDPVGMIGSWRQLGWQPDLGEWLAQPALMRDHLEPERGEIERALASGDWLEQMICLWNVGNRFVDGIRDLDGVGVWRYEDLAHDPVERYEELYRWCGLEWNAASRSAITEATTASSDQHRGFAWSLKGGLSRTAFRRMDSRAAVSAEDRRLTPAEIDRVRSATTEVLARFPRTNSIDA
jgi:hypothetical protein